MRYDLILSGAGTLVAKDLLQQLRSELEVWVSKEGTQQHRLQSCLSGMIVLHFWSIS